MSDLEDVKEDLERICAEGDVLCCAALKCIRELEAAQGVAVKPLDLSNLLKHAFLSGFVAAKDLPAHEPYNGNDAWVDYDPTDNAAYKRIHTALRALAGQGGE